MKFPSFKIEKENLKKYDFVVGVDEVGMGPLCGPVVSAACILNPKTIGNRRTKNCWHARVRDSKKTTEAQRKVLLKNILENSIACAVGEASAREIDKINILQASLLSKKRAIEKLFKSFQPRRLGLGVREIKFLILTDGLYTVPDLVLPKNIFVDQQAIVKGDGKILSIAAASIIAKVHRDNFLDKLHKKFPEYGFDKHKGYGTKLHHEKLLTLGPTPEHRKSFLKMQNCPCDIL